METTLRAFRIALICLLFAACQFTVTGVMIPNGADNGAGCLSNRGCKSNVCDPVLGVCVSCMSDSDCALTNNQGEMVIGICKHYTEGMVDGGTDPGNICYDKPATQPVDMTQPDAATKADGGMPDLAHATSDLASDDGPSSDLAKPADSDGDSLPDLTTSPTDLASSPDLIALPDLVLSAPTCMDGIKNQNETDIDCGGAKCPKCADAKTCVAPSDCISGGCLNNGSNLLTCSPRGYSWVLITNVGTATQMDCIDGNNVDTKLALPQTNVWTKVGPYVTCVFITQNGYASGMAGQWTDWNAQVLNLCKPLGINPNATGFVPGHAPGFPCN